MAVTWALTAEQIVDDACYMLGLAPLGKSPQAAHRAKGLQILNGVLKSMPWYGALWPSTTEDQHSFVIPAGSTEPIAAPANFFSSPVVKVGIDLTKDGFDRAANASSVGEMDSGGEWTVESGTWGIEDGALTP